MVYIDCTTANEFDMISINHPDVTIHIKASRCLDDKHSSNPETAF